MEQMTYPDLFSGEALRDEGTQQVLENAPVWSERAKVLLSSRLKRGTVIDGEGIRIMIQDNIGHPPHSNAYGAIVLWAVRRKLIEPTGVYVKSELRTNRARKVAQYRIL